MRIGSSVKEDLQPLKIRLSFKALSPCEQHVTGAKFEPEPKNFIAWFITTSPFFPFGKSLTVLQFATPYKVLLRVRLHSIRIFSDGDSSS
jgi:hypothetical protein